MEINKSNSLDELFDLVCQTEAQISFEETRSEFLKAIKGMDIPTKRKGRFFDNNTWLIATTVGVLGLAVAGYMFKDAAPTEMQENLPPVETPVAIDSQQVYMEHERIVREYEKEKAAPKMEEDLPSDDLEELLEYIEEPVPGVTQQQATSFITQQPGPMSEPLDSIYRFPILIEKDRVWYQKHKAKMLKQIFKWNKRQYAAIPPGRVELEGQEISIGAFYMQTTEVSNLQYRTFLFDLLMHGRKDDFLIARPDQKVWVNDYDHTFNQPMVIYYFSHEAYNNYPVVGVSRAGAEMYCQWLMAEMQKAYGKKLKGRLKELRLPTEAEWIWAARGGQDSIPYPWGGSYVRNAKGRYLANFKPLKENYKADGALYTTAVDTYFPNGYGLYCMSGNVAEMIYYSRENHLPGTKGGSWTSTAHEIKINGPDRFKGVTKPSIDIGFRVMGVYINLPFMIPIPQMPKLPEK